MGIWKDQKRKDWRYSFEHQKKTYAAGGFKTKGEARAAREARRAEVKAGLSSTDAEKIPGGTVYSFREVANTYLDDAERRFARKTFVMKRKAYKDFLNFLETNYGGDMSIIDISPQILHEFLSTKESNNSYNAYRKDLCALLTFARKRLVEQIGRAHV